MLDILRSIEPSSGPIPLALLYVEECLAGKRLAREALRMAKAASIPGTNADLTMLLLARWASLSCRVGQSSETSALIQRAHALLSDRTPPEITAEVRFAEAQSAASRGNREEETGLYRQSVALLSAQAPRFKYAAWELAMCLARQGLAGEIETLLTPLESSASDDFPLARALAPRFLAALETGQADFAAQCLARIPEPRALFRQLGVPFETTAPFLLAMMQTSTTVTPVADPAQEPVAIRITRHLLNHQSTAALELARITANRHGGEVTGTGFQSFSLIRAELAERHADAARRLIALRQSTGNRHYLDDFFLARVERLAGDAPEASHRFALAMQHIDTHNAHRRLDFELALAGELNHADVLQMSHPTPPSRPPPSRSSTTEPIAPLTDDRLIGNSAEIRSIRDMIHRFADLDAPVLITGETGTGKELVARALHDSSRRSSQPFVAVNCGSIAESLLESELFGHERGAFTGADRANVGLFMEAGEGTIFLDEMGEILPRVQRALLRVLETGEIRAVGSPRSKQIRCRILAATNADLNRLSNDSGFRKDLVLRLQRLGIYIPALRERRDDILPLARHFLDLGRRSGVHATMSGDLAQTINAYDWPGNVRELRNVIERMRLLHSDKLDYTLADLDLKFHMVGAPPPPPPATPRPASSQPDDLTPHRIRLPGEEVLFHEGRSRIRRLDRIHELFKRHRKLTRSELAETLDISPNTATKDLQTLVKLGAIRRIEPSGSSRSVYFIINE